MKLKRIRYSRKKIFLGLFLFLMIFGIGIGYAFVTTKLEITGTAKVKDAKWDIYFDNYQELPGSVAPSATPVINGTSITFSARVDDPGDFYGFTLDIVNDGTINAQIANFTVSPDFSTIDYIDSTIEYTDGSPISTGDLLPAGVTKTIKVLLAYKTGLDESSYPTDDESYNVTVSSNYEQYTVTSGQPTGILDEDSIVGNYFVLQPDATTASTSTAGFSGSTNTTDQTLWRIIKVNDNGQIEAVSEYASTGVIEIRGTPGYKNYVAGLQDVASKYAKSGYTVATRMFGYDGQTDSIFDTSYFDGDLTVPPGKTTTPSIFSGTGQEYNYGVRGDTLSIKDYLLLKNVYGNNSKLGTTRKNGTNAVYWVASRYYMYESDTKYSFRGYGIDNEGLGYSATFRSYYRADDSATGNWSSYGSAYSVRPIITLRRGVEVASGAGTQQNPYILK